MNSAHARILVAEYESIIALDIKRILEKAGHSVLSIVKNCEDVLTEARNQKPDLVLMDIQLKGNRSGIEAAEKISTDYNIPVVYLSALSDGETSQKTKFFGYVLKPFNGRVLNNTIERALFRFSGRDRIK